MINKPDWSVFGWSKQIMAMKNPGGMPKQKGKR
jgi:hypothetical protein